MQINRHFIKNIVLTISWAVLTFITDSLIINFYCIDSHVIKTDQLTDFYELEMCVQSKDIIVDSIYIFAGLLGVIGFYQLTTSVFKKYNANQIADAIQLRTAAQSLIIISACLFAIMKVSIAS